MIQSGSALGADYNKFGFSEFQGFRVSRLSNAEVVVDLGSLETLKTLKPWEL
jgi:hypothetical protein